MLDRRDASRRPGRIFYSPPLVPIVDLTFEDHLVAILYGDLDRLRFDLRMTPKAYSILLFTFAVPTPDLMAILFVRPHTPDSLHTSSSAAVFW